MVKSILLLSILSVLFPSSIIAATISLPDAGEDGAASLPEALHVLSVLAGQAPETTAGRSLILPDIGGDGALGLGEAIHCLAIAAGRVPNGGIAVRLTGIPPYPNTGGEPLEGEVYGIDPEAYQMAVYLRVADLWYIKPTTASPGTDIASDGTWRCSVVTGGYDAYAGAAAAYLLPVDAAIPDCNPCYEQPEIPGVAAMAETALGPVRTIDFGGYEWQVKRRDFPAAPGSNYFSDSPESVWVDNEGLHLTVESDGNRWVCSEVSLTRSLGYGIYRFYTRGRIDTLDPRMVLGLFTWDPTAPEAAFRELDIEFTRWGDPQNDTNAQYAVQPCGQCPGCGDRCSRFRVDLSGTAPLMTHYLIWEEGRVEFRSYLGLQTGTPVPADQVQEWRFSGDAVPVPGKETVHLNLWLLADKPPLGDPGREVVIAGFQWSEGTVADLP